MPGDLSKLVFPTIVDYDMEVFGNPFEIIDQSTFEYTYTG